MESLWGEQETQTVETYQGMKDGGDTVPFWIYHFRGIWLFLKCFYVLATKMQILYEFSYMKFLE